MLLCNILPEQYPIDLYPCRPLGPGKGRFRTNRVYITVISGQSKSPARTPITSPVISETNRLIKSPSKSPFGSPLGQNRPIKSIPIRSPTITQDEIFTGQNCVTVTEEETETLALVPVLDETTGDKTGGDFGDISGEIIIPPDANDNTNIEEDLFRFKKPALEFLENEEKPKKAKKKSSNKRKHPDLESVSTKSSRKIAIEKRKKADFNIEKNTAGKKIMNQTLVHLQTPLWVIFGRGGRGRNGSLCDLLLTHISEHFKIPKPPPPSNLSSVQVFLFRILVLEHINFIRLKWVIPSIIF